MARVWVGGGEGVVQVPKTNNTIGRDLAGVVQVWLRAARGGTYRPGQGAGVGT